MDLSAYREEFLAFLKQKIKTKQPLNLYQPVDYILNLGGKRIRPLLVLMSLHALEKDYKQGLHAALAVEVFHNFTLLHDDIMDEAPIRRGKETVHKKWDVNTAILSGDAMMILANQCLEVYDAKVYKSLMQLFQKTAIEVCEGQQYDMDFETRTDVTLEEYIEMIRLKTSVLIAAALQMGAIIAQATEEEQDAFYQFGLNLGLAFQLQDDYLDAFGDSKTFGKKVGGDIIENKKTFLVLKAQQSLTGAEALKFKTYYSTSDCDEVEKIREVKRFFKKSGAVTAIQQEINNYTQKSFQVLEKINMTQEAKNQLIDFGNHLMGRTV
ncbi:polyprenyl synthetase family protein [Ochrovirga pacifica]|uniref:polyprenyl synthetase family protein n=1 Tax=Ochrovirga pacifica TaxID=1042376 RepID=UPI000255A008|nr:polyprenyl synthetase family protein [Ochrovirga pacifica]